jgi:hypothetical protein
LEIPLSHDQIDDFWLPFWLQGIGHNFRLSIRTLLATPTVSPGWTCHEHAIETPDA